MKRALFALFVTLLSSSPAVSDTFSVAAVYSPNYADSAMITWTSPVTGTIDISGNAWTTLHTSVVQLEYIPASLAPSIDNPGNGTGGALEGGTTALLGGSVQAGLDPSSPYYETAGHPAAFGTSASIPCENGPLPCGAYQAPLPPIAVNQGDMIAAVIENYYLYSGDTVGLNLNVQIMGNAQGSGGTLANPQVLTGASTGFGGTLDPSSNHSTDVYEFYWGGGDFGGTAATNAIFGNSSVPGGFASGMQLNLYGFPTDNLIGSLTVLDNSVSSGPFDFGSQPAGNYPLHVKDLNANDDPPYNIEFRGPVGAPNGPVSTPEPASILQLGAALAGLAFGGHRFRR